MSDPQETAQTCYAMAYFLLPQYVFNQPDKVIRELSSGPIGAMFFYVMTCKVEGQEPNREAIGAFAAHTGSLNPKYDYYIIQYPSPPPVNLSDVEPERMVEEMHKIVLAPYFSAMMVDTKSQAVMYFILGQSPDGFTTLRSVTPTTNAIERQVVRVRWHRHFCLCRPDRIVWPTGLEFRDAQ